MVLGTDGSDVDLLRWARVSGHPTGRRPPSALGARLPTPPTRMPARVHGNSIEPMTSPAAVSA